MKKVVIKQDPEEPIPAEVIAKAIIDINKGMTALNKTRLTRRAIVTLLHENSKVARSTIEVVLNNLETIEVTWLKKGGRNE